MDGLHEVSRALLLCYIEMNGFLCISSKIGLGYEKNAQALSRGELCRRDFATGSDKSPYASCKMTVPLNILILHNHCPLFTRLVLDMYYIYVAFLFLKFTMLIV